jgi:erythromycin esterase-like protein
MKSSHLQPSSLARKIVATVVLGTLITVASIIFYSRQFSTVDHLLKVSSMEELVRVRARALESRRQLLSWAQQLPEREAQLFALNPLNSEEVMATLIEITKQQIVQRKVKFLSLEANSYLTHELNLYVLHLHQDSTITASSLLKDYSVWPELPWSSDLFIEFVEWLKTYNQKRNLAERIGLYGLDLHDAHHALTFLKNFLSKHTTLYPQFEKSLNCLGRDTQKLQAYAASVASGGHDCSLEIAYLVKVLKAQLPELFPHQDRLLFYINRLINSIEYAEEFYRQVEIKEHEAHNSRVKAMASSFYELLEFYSQRPGSGIFWGQGVQVGSSSATLRGLKGLDSLGAFLREDLGSSSVMLIGTTLLNSPDLAPPNPGSFDHLLLNIPKRRFYIPFSQDDVLTQKLAEPWAIRLIGPVYNVDYEPQTYVPSVIPVLFDGLLVIQL